MGFFDEIKKPESKVIILFDYDVPLQVNYWFHKEAGIYQFQLTQPDETYIDPEGVVVRFEYVNNKIYSIIGTILVDSEAYTQVDTYADLFVQPKSFYYDVENRILYLALENFDWKDGYRISPSVVEGFCNMPEGQDGAYFNDEYFEPRLLSSPNLTRKKDPLQFGLFNYLGNSAKLNNADGYFDLFGQNSEFARLCRYRIGTDTLDFNDYYKAYIGKIKDFTRSFEEINIAINEKRDFLKQKIPLGKYTQTEFIYLNDENVDKSKPIAYGKVLNAQAICLDEEQSPAPTNNTFHFVDTDYCTAVSLDAVYLVEDDIKTQLTVVSTNLSEGTFQIANTDCFNVSGDLLKIICDFTASDSGGYDQIEDLMDQYDDTPFINDNYDVSEWNEFKASYNTDVSTYYKDEKELKEVIERICKSLGGIFYPKDDGKYTLRVRDESAPAKGIIFREDFKNNPMESQPFKEYLSKCIVTYKTDRDTDNRLERYVNTDFEEDSETQTNQSASKTFPTDLTTRADAIEFSNRIMSESKLIVSTYDVKTDLRYIYLDIFDFVLVSFNRELEDENYNVYEVVSKTVNLTNDEITFKLRYVRNSSYDRNLLYADSGWAGESVAGSDDIVLYL